VDEKRRQLLIDLRFEDLFGTNALSPDIKAGITALALYPLAIDVAEQATRVRATLAEAEGEVELAQFRVFDTATLIRDAVRVQLAAVADTTKYIDLKAAADEVVFNLQKLLTSMKIQEANYLAEADAAERAKLLAALTETAGRLVPLQSTDASQTGRFRDIVVPDDMPTSGESVTAILAAASLPPLPSLPFLPPAEGGGAKDDTHCECPGLFALSGGRCTQHSTHEHERATEIVHGQRRSTSCVKRGCKRHVGSDEKGSQSCGNFAETGRC
jgi:hypothetical protein